MKGLCPMCVGTLPIAVPGRRVDGLAGLVSLYDYDERVGALVLAAKNGARRDLLGDLGDRLAGAVVGQPDVPLHARPIVTWVPASRAGRRRRGYDHGQVLARTVAERLGLGQRRLLIRRRGEAQSGSDRVTRQSGPAVRCPVALTGPVILIDDVVTTGASLRAAAAGLHRAGAGSVFAATVASAAGTSQKGDGDGTRPGRRCATLESASDGERQERGGSPWR